MTFKPFCHPSEIVFSIDNPLVFTCGECRRDQLGFLGFLYLVAMHSSQEPSKLLRKGKKSRKPDTCSTCGEQGHKSRYCPQNKKGRLDDLNEEGTEDDNDD